MARASSAIRSAVSLVVASRTAKVVGPPVEMEFKRVRRLGGSEIAFDLNVRGGNSTDIAIVNPFIPDHVYYDDEILASATHEMRDIRASSLRPLFMFTNGAAVVASVQVDLSSSRPRVIGTPGGSVHVRG